jgi:sorting nexin-3/12
MEENSVLEMSIAGHRNIKDSYTEYEVVCITNDTSFDKCYMKVYRRYSDFRRLHLRLRCLTAVLPEFPRRRWGKMKEEVVGERIEMLNVYLRFVCEYVQRSSTASFKKQLVRFIQEDK